MYSKLKGEVKECNFIGNHESNPRWATEKAVVSRL
jgi:hypothetical protein